MTSRKDETPKDETFCKDETTCKAKSAAYEVGYGKPPGHTRFRKGKSGNPRGRPARKAAMARASALALKEAYRIFLVEEGDQALELTAIQTILRRQVERAVRGDIDAQRFVLATVQKIERENRE